MGCSAKDIINCALLDLVDKLATESDLQHMPSMYEAGKVSRKEIVRMMRSSLNKEWVRSCLIKGRWSSK